MQYHVYNTIDFHIIIGVKGIIVMLKIEKREYVNRTYRMPKSLVEEMSQVAQDKNISVNQLVITLCEYGLENLDKSEE